MYSGEIGIALDYREKINCTCGYYIFIIWYWNHGNPSTPVQVPVQGSNSTPISVIGNFIQSLQNRKLCRKEYRLAFVSHILILRLLARNAMYL
jgi:hypothetical protein